MNRLLYLSLIGAGAIWYYGRRTYEKYAKAVKQMKFNFLGISNLKINTQAIKFDTKLEIVNNSLIDIDFSTGGHVVLRQIRFFTNDGHYLGTATPNMSAIKIPAKSRVEIKEIPTKIPLKNLGGLISDISSIMDSAADLKMELTIDIHGKKITIDA